MSNDTGAAPSYHDVHVTTAKFKRTRIFDLPYGYELTCTRTGGWQLWGPREQQAPPSHFGPFPGPLHQGPKLIAGEYDNGLRVDVDGHVICDSLTRRTTSA